MRDLLWRCDEHRGPDADFPALRGNQGTGRPHSSRPVCHARTTGSGNDATTRSPLEGGGVGLGNGTSDVEIRSRGTAPGGHTPCGGRLARPTDLCFSSASLTLASNGQRVPNSDGANSCFADCGFVFRRVSGGPNPCGVAGTDLYDLRLLFMVAPRRSRRRIRTTLDPSAGRRTWTAIWIGEDVFSIVGDHGEDSVGACIKRQIIVARRACQGQLKIGRPRPTHEPVSAIYGGAIWSP